MVEVGRPKRPLRRSGAKTDALDAIRAAREALAQDHILAPRRRGDREAMRVLLATRHSACAAKVCVINQLKALIVGAPDELRAELDRLAAAGRPTNPRLRCPPADRGQEPGGCRCASGGTADPCHRGHPA